MYQKNFQIFINDYDIVLSLIDILIHLKKNIVFQRM